MAEETVTKSAPETDGELKTRRGLLAAAWGAVVGFVMAQTTRPVEAAQVSLIYENAAAGAPLNLPAATVLIINRSDFNLGAGTNVLEVQSTGTPAGLTAVFGSSTNSNGVLGTSKSGIGVLGQVPSSSNSNATGVYGLNYSTYAGPSPGAGDSASMVSVQRDTAWSAPPPRLVERPLSARPMALPARMPARFTDR
jgi:hypothetical protein